jgi:hypothetical protein
MWEHGNVMLGFDAEERLILKLPHDFADKIVWESRYARHNATSARDALAWRHGIVTVTKAGDERPTGIQFMRQ